MRKFPFTIDNSKRDVFVGRAGTEMQKNGLIITLFFDDLVRRSLGFVDKIRIENIEL